jgi:hypothetical protein
MSCARKPLVKYHYFVGIQCEIAPHLQAALAVRCNGNFPEGGNISATLWAAFSLHTSQKVTTSTSLPRRFVLASFHCFEFSTPYLPCHPSAALWPSQNRVLLSYDSRVPIPTQQALDQWQLQRTRLRRWFWIYLLISAIGAFFFVRSFRSPDPYTFALLLLIPLIGLRQAWWTDRQIVACDRHIRENRPIIEGTDKLEEKAS